MSYKEICFSWVEHHKYEDDEGRFYILDSLGNPGEEPYTEPEIDDILWDRAVSGEAAEDLIA